MRHAAAHLQRNDGHSHTVRVRIQLLDARTDKHLWARDFDFDSSDVLAFYSQAGLAIVGEMQIKLTPQEKGRLSNAKPVDPEVYKSYLKGKYYLNQWTNASLWKAIRHFKEALDLDPTYAPAWAETGAAYEWLGGFARGASLSREDALLRAKAALERAVQLDPALRGPHQALGRMKLAEWDWEGGALEFQRAKEIDPNWGGSVFLTIAGRFDEAVAAQRRQSQLNPLDYSSQLVLGLTYFMAGRFDESIMQLKKTNEMDPDIHHAHYELAWNYAKKGMFKEAIAECETSLVLLRRRQPEAFAAPGCGWVYALAGRRREALEIAHKLEKRSGDEDNSIQLAHLYDALGDRNRAMAFLSKAYESRDPKLPTQWFSPIISDKLRADPRFQELIRRTGIPWATFAPVNQSQTALSKSPPERNRP